MIDRFPKPWRLSESARIQMVVRSCHGSTNPSTSRAELVQFVAAPLCRGPYREKSFRPPLHRPAEWRPTPKQHDQLQRAITPLLGAPFGSSFLSATATCANCGYLAAPSLPTRSVILSR